MNFPSFFNHFFTSMILLLTVTAADAARPEKLELPSLFSNNMILQCGQNVCVWGWDKPESKVSVSIAGQKSSAIANENGRWQVKLSPMKPGGPFEMIIENSSERRCIKNVLIGEIWLCSGQSNMKLPLKDCQDGVATAAKAENSSIRLFTVPFASKETPQVNFSGQWEICTPKKCLNFSGLAIFFALDLYRELKIPVGVIDCSFGGTQAEAWTDPSLLNTPMLKPILERYQKDLTEYPAKKKDYDNQRKIYKELKPKQTVKVDFVDKDLQSTIPNWTQSDFDDSAWQKFWFGNTLEVRWPGGAVMCFRFPLTLPADWTGKKLTLSKFSVLGNTDIFLDGKKLGECRGNGFQTVNLSIPADMVNRKMLFSIRVCTSHASGAFTGMPTLLCSGVSGEVSLKGYWWWHAEKTMPGVKAGVYPYIFPPNGPGSKDSVGGLYNGMICPLAPFAVRGVLWYQGEGNHPRAFQYRELLPAMIKSWRNLWKPETLPFIIVQLPNYRRAPSIPQSNSYWAELRESQQITASQDNNSALVTTIDIGDAANLHPRNKKDVAARSVLAALRLTYEKPVLSSGPTYDSMKIENNKIRIKFNNTGNGLTAKDGTLRQFAIAGKDRKFYWAKAIIEGNTVIVSSESVLHPVAVRYAWADNPEGCNLYNAAGLPATPFRTDSWPCHSQNRR